MWIKLILILTAILFILYRVVTKNYNFFVDRGIPYKKPTFLFGSMWDVIIKRKSFLDLIIDLYNEHDGKVYGIFDQRQPIFLIRDPELIKQITVKDFDHFVNHRTSFGDENDENNLFASSLFMMKNNRWKDMRNTLTPAFTGSKMRSMFQLMEKVAKTCIDYMKSQLKDSSDASLEMDAKEFISRYSNDVIASTAFGLEINSFVQANNEFFLAGKKLTKFGFRQSLKFFLYQHMKSLFKILRIDLFDTKATKYFMRLVLDAMKYRQEHNIVRQDMIHMLMEAKGISPSNSENVKSSNYEWKDSDIVGQCFLFFFAGFETTASLISFVAFEIMANPDVQEKLLHEIESIESKFETHNGGVIFDKIQNMQYLDMVLSETLRKWAGALIMDRVCTKDITYDLGTGSELILKQGDCIWLPAAGLHYDEKYFPNPMKFDPERFSPENKEYITPFTYIPFGVGPRNCIGLRFAQLEAKVLIYYLVREFRLERSSKTVLPIKMAKNGFQLVPNGGFWIKFIPRN